MSAHTPGPWHWSRRWLTPGNGSAPLPFILWYTTDDDGVHCTDADARLIAASPDLYAAAELAEAVLARGKWVEGSPDPEAVALRALRAALAKAVQP